jgi:hypothetical protein
VGGAPSKIVPCGMDARRATVRALGIAGLRDRDPQTRLEVLVCVRVCVGDLLQVVQATRLMLGCSRPRLGIFFRAGPKSSCSLVTLSSRKRSCPLGWSGWGPD